jgi:tetratricopeptide (TPR) repeat protein
LALWQELGDPQGRVGPLNRLGEVARYQGDYARAKALYEQSLALWQELGYKGGIAEALTNLGATAANQGDYARAKALCEQSLALWQELGDKSGIAETITHLGRIALFEGNSGRARALLEESLAQFRKLEEKRGIAECIEGLAWTACSQGQATDDAPRFARAARLLGAALALRESTGNPMPPAYRTANDRTTAAIRAQLDEATFSAAWESGRALTLEQAIAETLNC